MSQRWAVWKRGDVQFKRLEGENKEFFRRWNSGFLPLAKESKLEDGKWFLL